MGLPDNRFPVRDPLARLLSEVDVTLGRAMVLRVAMEEMPELLEDELSATIMAQLLELEPLGAKLVNNLQALARLLDERKEDER